MMRAIGLQTAIWNREWFIFFFMALVPTIYYLNILVCVVLIQGSLSAGGEDSLVSLKPLMWIYGLYFLWVLVVYNSSDFIIRNILHTFPISKGDAPKLFSHIEEISIVLGLDAPRVDLMRSNALNGLSYGINKTSNALILTTGLIEKASEKVSKAVIAQELVQLKLGYTRLLTLIKLYANLPFFVILVFLLGPLASNMSSNSDLRYFETSSIENVLIFICALIMNYLFFSIIRIFLQKRLELQSDAISLKVTKDPEALIEAINICEGVKVSSVSMEFEAEPNDKAEKDFSHRLNGVLPFILPGLAFVGHDSLVPFLSFYPTRKSRIKAIRKAVNVYD